MSHDEHVQITVGGDDATIQHDVLMGDDVPILHHSGSYAVSPLRKVAAPDYMYTSVTEHLAKITRTRKRFL